MVDKRSHIGR